MQIDTDNKTDVTPELAPINPLIWTVSVRYHLLLLIINILIISLLGKRSTQVYWSTHR